MTNSPSELTFEQSLAELEQVVRDLEDAQLGLDEALGRYERGVGLIKRCQRSCSRPNSASCCSPASRRASPSCKRSSTRPRPARRRG